MRRPICQSHVLEVGGAILPSLVSRSAARGVFAGAKAGGQVERLCAKAGAVEGAVAGFALAKEAYPTDWKCGFGRCGWWRFGCRCSSISGRRC